MTFVWPSLLAALVLVPVLVAAYVVLQRRRARGADALATSGLLAAGYHGDVITLDADPLEDISVLGNPARVTGVWKASVRVKS